MSNWSLIYFTLLTQSSIGLLWLSVLVRWTCGVGDQGTLLWNLSTALILSVAGLVAAIGHLSKPHLAPHALRNLKASWLSREVVLVQTFAGMLALLILQHNLKVHTWVWLWELATCFMGKAALIAMTRVYMLRTVPVWNSPATPLEFIGSALLLGGGIQVLVTAILSAGQIYWPSSIIASFCGMGLGFILKLIAIPPALSAEAISKIQTWYAPVNQLGSQGQAIVVRMGCNLAGLGMILTTVLTMGRPWLWASMALACIIGGELLGRWRFFGAYCRIGM